MSLKNEYFAAQIRATLLEGRVYAVEFDGQFVSVSLWFRKPNSMYKS